MATGFGGPGTAADYKINTVFTSADLTVRVCAPNNGNRYALIVSDSGGNINYGINPSNLGANKGEIQQSPGAGFFILTYRDLGPYVQSALYCVRNSGGSNLYCTEIVYAPRG